MVMQTFKWFPKIKPLDSYRPTNVTEEEMKSICLETHSIDAILPSPSENTNHSLLEECHKNVFFK